MNDIIIVPKEIQKAISYEGIEFSNCTFIDIFIDGVSIEESEDFESGVVCWDQLQGSSLQEGKYLLFTCYCGIPDDAGWGYIFVEHSTEHIVWHFDRITEIKYRFNKLDYIEQIASCKKLLNLDPFPLAVPTSSEPSY